MNVESVGRATLMAFLAAPLFSCSSGEPETAFAGTATRRSSVAAAASQISGPAATGEALRLVLAPTGNAARYRVREQLVGHDLQNDAVGETKSLTGALSIDSAGKVIPGTSKFTLDAATFVSDRDRRDGFVRGRLLEADSYPTITLAPKQIKGVGLPLPKAGSAPIEMIADLTVRGVTRSTTWKGTAQFGGDGVAGSASTAFTFDDMQLEQPRVPVLLSVADTIKLEIDFNLVRQH
ncbi:MAG: YceI family protein [Gemmatimonadaceae bacterium]|jgi:polyisoprenoid-binding protein YceI